MNSILVTTETPFINPWTKDGSKIGSDPVRVPYDNLCRCYLKDGSLQVYKEKKTTTEKKSK